MAEIFVFLDDVQYDTGGWRNRNLIKTPNGLEWLTVPVIHKGVHDLSRPICDIRFAPDKTWKRKHLKTLYQNYSRAQHFEMVYSVLEAFYSKQYDLFVDFVCDLTIELSRLLSIDHSKFLRSSSFSVSNDKNERLIQILRTLNCTEYVSGPSAKSYICFENFRDAGISIEFMTYEYPEYPQLHGAFKPNVSILDLLFNTGFDAPSYVWNIP